MRSARRSTQSTQSVRSTLKDVARECGVSTATVSFVINNTRTVRPDTRDRVLETARRLGYSANPLALGLSTGRSHTLGLLLPDLNVTLITQIITGVEKAARKHGYKILPILHHEAVDEAVASLPDLSARRLDGFLSTAWSAGEHPEIVTALPSIGLPYGVVYYRAAPHTGVDNLIVDHKQGGLLAGRHLLKRGCRHIAFLGGLRDREVTGDRLEGLREACRERGVLFRDDLVFYGEFSVTEGEARTRELLSAPVSSDRPRFDGIFAASDQIAAGSLRVLRKAGLRVPDDIPVVAFNDQSIADLPTLP